MGVDVRWVLPPERLCCEIHEVHVWRAELDHHAWDLSALSGILNEEEIARTGRFIRPCDRDRFTICRAGLRLILSRYLNVGARAIRFRIDEKGKPWLTNDSTTHGLNFSLSDSADLALYAVCCGSETGVDVEYVDARLSSVWIAERFFAPDEVSSLREMSGDAGVESFFRFWTRMEAHMKACGRGLAGADRAGIEDRSGWSFYDLAPMAGYVGTLVAAGSDHRVVCYDLSPSHVVFS